MVDNVQSEWSTVALTTFLQLIGAVSKGKPAPVAVHHLPPSKKAVEKQTWVDVNLLTVNFSLSNVNIYACNDYKGVCDGVVRQQTFNYRVFDHVNN